MAARGPRGTGTVYRRKDGRYEGAGYVLTPNGGSRRIRTYGTTRAEAHARLQALLERSRKGIPAPKQSWTVAAWLDHWMTNVVAVKNRPRTVELYESTIRLHIKPYLGTRRLTHLSVTDVQTAINALLTSGHTPRTVHKMRTVLSAALSRALREELILRNVARLVELPAYERKEIRPWNVAQATRFLDQARGHDWELGYQLLILYGMRRGEVLGLRWSDIDLDTDTLRITQQLQRIDGALRTGPVKTNAGRRTLPLLPTVRQTLLAHADTHGINLSDTAALGEHLILTSGTGNPVEPGNFARTFQVLTEHAGLPRITVHHTRHTAATLLKHLGVPARDAQLILGHSNVTTTQQLYQHTDIESKRDALASVERALNVGRAASSTVPTTAEPGDVSRQRRPTDDSSATTPTTRQAEDTNENRRLTEAETAGFFGGSGGTRTLDILLKSTIPVLAELLPASVISDLHVRTKRHMVGRVAVNYSRQTVPSTVPSTRDMDDLITTRTICRAALTEQMRRRSFPLNLIPTADPKEARP
ncbi:MAG TPA: site-specific integrase [Pseudolysinimonas sp.]|nr:site-specific integrase [Pseudolysinimonas sp.]